MKYLLTLLVIVFLAGAAAADDFSEALLKAKKKLKEADDKNDMSILVKARGDFERILQLKKNQWLVNYYMAMCDFSLSYGAMEKKDNDEVRKYTESSLDLLNKATDMKDDFAEAYILKLAVNSNRWVYEFDKMNDIIAKGAEAKDMGMKLEAGNPRLWLIDGMNTFYTPENFGGGPDKALPLFEKSYELFKTYKPKDETYPDWGRDQVHGMIALCNIKSDKLDDAKKWIDEGLALEPESGFLKSYVMKEYEEAKKK